MNSEVLNREKEFHDAWAESVDPRSVKVDALAEACTMPETRYILSEFAKNGGLKGKKILEIGCGCGEASVYFAKQGAVVTATDISNGMVRLTQRVADYHQVSLTGLVCSADALPFPENSFDIVYGANVLHHVDMAKTLDEIRRVLKPGGIFACWDPILYNPAIRIYRRLASGVRSVDEHPVDRKYIKEISKRFYTPGGICAKGFWLSSCLIFVKYYFIDKVDPSKERYWKKVVDDSETIKPLYSKLERIDQVLLKRFPFLKWLCWNMVVIVRKE